MPTNLSRLFRGIEGLYGADSGLDPDALLVPSEAGVREQLLLRETEDGALEVGLALDEETLRAVQDADVHDALSDARLGDTLPVLEGLSHLVYVADHLRHLTEHVRERAEHRERSIAGDLGVRRLADAAHVLHVDRAAVQALGHDAADVQRPITHAPQRMRARTAGLTLRLQVVDRERTTRTPRLRRPARVRGQQVNDVRLDIRR